MVGVGQGNKSALGRVTLVLICFSLSCYFICTITIRNFFVVAKLLGIDEFISLKRMSDW